MGNIALITLYQDTEATKEELYQYFLKENIAPDDPSLLTRERNPEKPMTEVLEITKYNANIIDFVHQNLDTLSESKFTKLLKRSLNWLHEKDSKAEFKFVFFLPFSKLDRGFSAIKSLFESSNQRISNSMFLIVTNDTLGTANPLSDDDMYNMSIAHPEVKALTDISEKDNIVVNLPKKDRFKDHLLRAMRLNPGSFLNYYQVDPVQVDEEHKELIIGQSHVGIMYKKAELVKNPKIEQNVSQLSTLVIGDFTGDYQRIVDEGERRSQVWIYVLLTILGILVIWWLIRHNR